MTVLVCGLSPLPFTNSQQTSGPGLRTWQFARGLAEAGHSVHLLALNSDEPELRYESVDGVEINYLDHRSYFYTNTIRDWIRTHQPRCLVGATTYGSFAIARTQPTAPFWADQFGHFMAEAQATAARHQQNWPLPHHWDFAKVVGQYCDHYSVVSASQRLALIGELGALGRLTAETCGYEFVSVLPCAALDERTAIDAALAPSPALAAVPENAFVVLWSGGYNVWSDEETLFRALEAAMEQEGQLHFVSTGGAIEGTDDSTYSDFKARISRSKYRERFHLLGWLPGDQVPLVQERADLGIITELPIYEGLLGSKNRVIEWMAARLPFVTTDHGELGTTLAELDLAGVFPPADWAKLRDQILSALRNPQQLEARTTRAHQYANQHHSVKTTTKPLVQWAEEPVRAPDGIPRARLTGPASHGSVGQSIAALTKRVRLLSGSRLLHRVNRFRQNR